MRVRSFVSIAFIAAAACNGARGTTNQDARRPPERAAAAPPPTGDGGLAADEAHQDEAAHEALPSRVRLAPDVVRAAGVKTAPVALAALPLTVTLNGEVIADPDHSAKIATRVAGRVVDVRFREGERVKAGELLAVIESPELARARAAFTSASSKARTARLNAERLSRLAEKGLAASQELATAESEAQALEAEARAARQTLSAFGVDGGSADGTSAARLELRAPISAWVLTRDAVRGQTVGADHVLATLADLGRVFFQARLFEKDLGRVRVGAAAEVRLNAYPGEVFTGHIELVGRQLDPQARTVTARIPLDNKNDLLKVGLFGTANIVVPDAEVRPQRPVVPLQAVTQIAGKDVVFVRQPDEDYEVHAVTLGRSAAGRVEILHGLRPKEQVVVDGVFTLKSAVLRSTFSDQE
jgi:cobalt-zinc-cadmium efflux system membrane fusion protein